MPIVRITRDFAGTPAQLFRAHTDPELFARWIGPDGMTDDLGWDATQRRHVALRRSATATRPEFASTAASTRSARADRADLHLGGPPDGVALETLTFEDLGDGRTRLTRVAVRQLRGPRRLAAQRHGGRSDEGTPPSTASSATAPSSPPHRRRGTPS